MAKQNVAPKSGTSLIASPFSPAKGWPTCPTCGKPLMTTWKHGLKCQGCNPEIFAAEKNFRVGEDNFTGD
jgi:hypothetical protein